ncbi:unnamed protein product [Paramecium primaurelia]|uniref:Transmembrane protein n=1 Tax=Paramecium primaurelia TaxID=5886 RepID=A0A8S1KWK8_PARPR|nr:unnamed protein product [Paramecium primaurelia]
MLNLSNQKHLNNNDLIQNIGNKITKREELINIDMQMKGKYKMMLWSKTQLERDSITLEKVKNNSIFYLIQMNKYQINNRVSYNHQVNLNRLLQFIVQMFNIYIIYNRFELCEYQIECLVDQFLLESWFQVIYYYFLVYFINGNYRLYKLRYLKCFNEQKGVYQKNSFDINNNNVSAYKIIG